MSGAVAQLGEHLLCKQGVAGSSPAGSTRQKIGLVTRRNERYTTDEVTNQYMQHRIRAIE